MVCILIEMYTGELFYQAREEVEHMSMIEKECGPTPEWMAINSSNKTLRNIYLKNGKTNIFDSYQMRIDMSILKNKETLLNNWNKMKTLRQLV